jgi:hypothetical protein
MICNWHDPEKEPRGLIKHVIQFIIIIREPLGLVPRIPYRAAVNSRIPTDPNYSSDTDLGSVRSGSVQNGHHSPQKIESNRSIGDISKVWSITGTSFIDIIDCGGYSNLGLC